MASASLVGQALGRGEPDDAVQWGWDVSRLAMVVVGTIALVGVIAPDVILSIFLHDETTLELARWPLRILGITMAAETLGGVLLNTLLGAGASRLVMVVSISLQWGLFIPTAYLIGPVLGLGLTAVWIAQVSYRTLQAVVFALIWRSRRWMSVEV